ncbi:hypothetical protein BaRGS_00038655, partial [Batillaria attramentaria]
LSGVTSDISSFRLVDHLSTNFCCQAFCAAADILPRTISREYRRDTGFRPAKFENDMSEIEVTPPSYQTNQEEDRPPVKE